MKKIFTNKLVAAFFTLVLITTFARAAILRGTIYDARLNALPKAIVEINSTPRQTMVAIQGEYSFNVTPGYYEINALFENTSTTTNALITTEGDYRIDLVMIDVEIGELNPDEPSLPNALNETLAEEKTQPTTPTQNEIIAFLAIATLATATLIATALFFTRFKKQAKIQAKKTARKKARREVEEIVKEKSVVLTREQRELLEKIKESGGRLTQKELRKQVDYSEAKVSLDLDVLESQGLIKKIKKGRGNIIIAVE